ncbi:hypothetical protein BBJ28_00009316 [Nothophytophthora sp. Chile5]|nr:hypothetical protein BBJ28_00009316 [Nothophytophthora sp. Chile5]
MNELATRRSYLYLGGMLSSALSMMFMANLLNVFFRSAMLFNVNLVGRFYLGLFLFCGYVVFDTQMIIEKASMGDKDSLKHTLELFMGASCSCSCSAFILRDRSTHLLMLVSCVPFVFADFVSIFVRILVILLKNAGKEAKPAKNRSGRR